MIWLLNWSLLNLCSYSPHRTRSSITSQSLVTARTTMDSSSSKEGVTSKVTPNSSYTLLPLNICRIHNMSVASKGVEARLTASVGSPKVQPAYSSTQSLHKPAMPSVETFYLAAAISALKRYPCISSTISEPLAPFSIDRID